MSYNNFKIVTRRKVLVVPYIGDNMSTAKILMVKDLKTGEQGLISGGIKRKETPYQAAEREMSEETSGLFTKFKSKPISFTFTTLYRPPELMKIDHSRQEIVRSFYTIFLYEIPYFHVSLNNFVPNKEVSAIRMGKFDDFENVWSFCTDVFNKFLRDRSFKNNDVVYDKAFKHNTPFYSKHNDVYYQNVPTNFKRIST